MSLTVKWRFITVADGLETERLFPANQVVVVFIKTTDGKPVLDHQGRPQKYGDLEITQPTLLIDGGGPDGHTIQGGVCYVMNSEGRTVGSYNLEDTPEGQKLYT